MIYIVLGMHKSGTTLVAKILHESGIPMGAFDETLGYDEGNKYERRETHDLNIEMLGCDYGEFSLNILKVIKDPAEVKPEILGKIRAALEIADRQAQDWGFKDPRTCLTYRVWKTLIPKPRLVIIFRDPVELWLHYKPKHFLKSFRSFVVCWKAMQAWYVHNSEILKILQAGDEAPFVMEYGNLMKDDGHFNGLCRFTGRKLHDSRKTGLYRNKGKRRDFRCHVMLLFQKYLLKRDVWGLYQTLKKYESGAAE